LLLIGLKLVLHRKLNSPLLSTLQVLIWETRSFGSWKEAVRGSS
jgi:hypothetical protein